MTWLTWLWNWLKEWLTLAPNEEWTYIEATGFLMHSINEYYLDQFRLVLNQGDQRRAQGLVGNNVTVLGQERDNVIRVDSIHGAA